MLLWYVLTYNVVYWCLMLIFLLIDFFFVKQKTAYEMRISDWSSDVCSSDLRRHLPGRRGFRLQDRRISRGRVQEGRGHRPDEGSPRPPARSEERRVGKECVRTCKSRWSTFR